VQSYDTPSLVTALQFKEENTFFVSEEIEILREAVDSVPSCRIDKQRV
jgi:hypothetical protein